jgi:ABC-type polysaccharide/polyol phosphate export permease
MDTDSIVVIIVFILVLLLLGILRYRHLQKHLDEVVKDFEQHPEWYIEI